MYLANFQTRRSRNTLLSKMPTKRTKSQERKKKQRYRENEDEEAKKRRLEDQRQRQQQTRELESVDQKQNRLEDMRQRQQQYLETESVEDRQARLQSDKANHVQAREAESREKLFLASTRDVQPFTVGKMNKVCQGCKALMFSGKVHKRKLGSKGKAEYAMFSMCCRYGNMKTPTKRRH